MNALQQWIANGKPYQEGVAIYATTKGFNANLLRLFTKRESLANKAKLQYELSKLYKNTTTPVVVVTATKPEKPTINNTQPIAPEPTHNKVVMAQLPKPLRPVLEKAHALFIKNCKLKITLNETAPSAEKTAIRIQHQIDRNFEANRLCWKQIDYWLTHKEVLQIETEDFSKLNGAQLAKRQQYAYQNISKLKKRIALFKEELRGKLLIRERVKLEQKLKKSTQLLLKHETQLQTFTKLIDRHE